MKQLKRKAKIIIPIILCFCLLAPLFGQFSLAAELDDTDLHVIVTHWYQNEDGSQTPVQEEATLKAEGDFFDVKVRPRKKVVNPDAPAGEQEIKNIDEFSGLAFSAGQQAIGDPIYSGDDSTVKISYTTKCHVAKVHVFYRLTTEEQGLDFTGSPNIVQDLEVDTTKINGRKTYNTSEGLHTDKTVTGVESDGRTFNLELESWFSSGNLIDVAMVLDASGSMALISDGLEPMKVDTSAIGINTNEYIPLDKLNEILDTNYTDNSKLSYSNYTYYVFDKRTNTQEFVPLAYWNGNGKIVTRASESISYEAPKTGLVSHYSFDGNLTDSVSNENAKYIGKVDGNIFSSESAGTGNISYVTGVNGKALDLSAATGRYTNTTNYEQLGNILLYDASKTSDENKLALDTTTGKDNFTISFAIKAEKATLTDPTPMADVMYIGNIDKDYTNSTYHTILRAQQDSNAVFGTKGSSGSRFRWTEHYLDGESAKTNNASNTNRVINKSTWVVFTYVVENGKLTTYVDNKVLPASVDNDHKNDPVDDASNKSIQSILNYENLGIMLGGINPVLNQNIYIDEVYIYNRAITDTDELNALYNATLGKTMNASYSSYYGALAPDGESMATMITSLTEGLAKSTYDYYSKNVAATDVAGWYYASSNGNDKTYDDYLMNSNLATAKTYRGLTYDIIVENNIDYGELPKSARAALDQAAGGGAGSGATLVESGNGGYIYTGAHNFVGSIQKTAEQSFRSSDSSVSNVDGNNIEVAISLPDGVSKRGGLASPTIFFVDDEGYLRCFYSSGNPSASSGCGAACSYVYQKPDTTRIKAEILQYAFGSFASKLKEKSPDSRIAAVRFSNEGVSSEKSGESYLKQLVLLDWTKDTEESSNILGLQRGGATDYELSYPNENNENLKVTKGNGIGQYNYVMTGGTFTYRGLEAFQKYLANRVDRDERDEDDVQKYLIVFTDGRDQKNDKAEEIASELRADGYSIFCVMMATGALQDETEYNGAIDFLTKIAGPADGIPVAAQAPNYVFAEKTEQDLVEAFTGEIIEYMSSELREYTVQDYLDPRFNLVDADGDLIELNANGNIKIVRGDNSLADENDAKYDVTSVGNGYEVTVSYTASNDAGKALLCYDGTNKMYYLKWQNQTIPACSVGAQSLNVWRSQITVRAKDDFIGGNAILTNGNAAGQNMVYSEKDLHYSSGTDDVLQDLYNTTGEPGPDPYPSKGFPRTTVNVQTLDLKIIGDKQTIYLGESISPVEVLQAIGEATKTLVDNDPGETIEYWDYLERYASFRGYAELDTFLKEIEKDLLEKGTYTIPYYYLPNAEGTNQVGNRTHTGSIVNNKFVEGSGDAFGDITFTWEAITPDSPKPDIRYDYVVKDDEDRTYQLKVEYNPYSKSERQEWIEGSDSFYSNWWGEEKTDGSKTTNAEGMIPEIEGSYIVPKEPEPIDREALSRTTSGQHITDIVKGQIDMDVLFDEETLTYLKENYPGTTQIKYTATLTRNYAGEIIETKNDPKKNTAVTDQTVGTFTIDTTISELVAGWESGDLNKQFSFSFDPAFRAEYADDYYLPIGTYTLSEGTTGSYPSALKFGAIQFVVIDDEAIEDEETDLDHAHFSHIDADYIANLPEEVTGVKDRYSAAEYYAAEISADGSKAYLGTAGVRSEEYPHVNETTKKVVNDDYRDKRFALALVTPEIDTVELQIEKKVTGVVPDADSTLKADEKPVFTFKVDFKTAKTGGVTLIGTYDYKVYDSANPTTAVSTGKVKSGETVQLKAGQYVVIEKLPVDVYYTVTEVEDTMPDGYKPENEVYTKSGTITKNATTGALSNNKVVFTNEYEATGELTIIVEKTLEGKDWEDESFEFTLEGADAATLAAIAAGTIELPEVTTITVSSTDDEVDDNVYSNAFSKITFHSTGVKTTTYTFKVTETDAEVPGYTYDTQPKTISVTVIDNEDGTMDVKVDDTVVIETTVDFTNTYFANPVSETLSVSKEVTGDDLPANADYTFDFNLELTSNNASSVKLGEDDWETQTISVAVNSDDVDAKKADFPEITFTAAGRYKFEISEIDPEMTGFANYDKSVWTVEVVVVGVADGTDVNLEVESITYAKTGDVTADVAAFVNIFGPAPVKDAPQVTKDITTDGVLPADLPEFTFNIKLNDGQDATGVEITNNTVTVKGKGTESFENITFKKSGTYTFTITEDDSEKVVGYTYDSSEWTWTVTVADANKDGVLEVTDSNYAKNGTTVTSKTEATFVNVYETEATTFAPLVEKKITGDTSGTSKNFTFTITADASNPDGAKLPETTSLTITGEGSKSFDEIEFTKPGTYKFTLAEEKGSDKGYNYDEKSWTLTVVIEDINAKLVVNEAKTTYVQEDATEGADHAIFTNEYTQTPASIVAKVTKTVVGDTPEDHTFTFYLEAREDSPATGASLVPGDKAIETTITGTGDDVFKEIEFTEPGTYYFEIREMDENNVSGYTFSGEVWTLKVVVTDENSELKAVGTYENTEGDSSESADFVNTYSVEPVGFVPNVQKSISGPIPEVAQEFTFVIEIDPECDTTGVIMPEEASVTIKGAGTTDFNEIKFTKAGKYSFGISEKKKDIPGYTFDEKAWILDVEIIDEGGVFTHTAVYINPFTGEERSQEALFTNIYAPGETTYAPKVTKTVTGDAPKDATFAFVLEADPDNQDGATLPEDTKATITGSGSTEFDAITFTEAGTYKFTISEEKPSAPGYDAYDQSVWTLTVKVEDVDGVLKATGHTYQKAGADANSESADFVNPYIPTPVSYTPMVEKMVVESMPDDDDIFTFILEETDDAGLLSGRLEASVAGLGTAKFREITFTKAGTYTFEITEVIGNKAGYTYDESVWILTVVVEDVDAELKITSHIYDKNNMMITNEDAAQFVNIYIKDEEPSTDEPTTDEPTTEPPTEPAPPTDVNHSTQTGDSMNLILWISVMVVALIAAGAIVVIRIKKRR